MNKLTQVNIGQNFNSPLGLTKGVNDIISLLLSGAIAISGIILIFLFLGGGLKVIMGAGGGDPKGIEQGKQAITYALIGFLIVFISYWIIRAIELIIGVEFVTAPGFLRGPLGGM